MKNWWLLALSGVLDAMIWIIYFNYAGQGLYALKDIALLGKVGVSRLAMGKYWLLVLSVGILELVPARH